MNFEIFLSIIDENVSFTKYLDELPQKFLTPMSTCYPPISALHLQAILTTRILVTFIWAIVVSIALLFKRNANSTSNAFKLRDLWFFVYFVDVLFVFMIFYDLLTSLRAHSQFSSSSPSGQSFEPSQTASWRRHEPDLQVYSSAVHAILSEFSNNDSSLIFTMQRTNVQWIQDDEIILK